MTKQQVLIIIKPDAVQRGLIGKVVKRFEQVGLKIVGLKFIWADKTQIKNHYPETEAWFKKVGERTLVNYKKKGLDPIKMIGTNDPLKIGRMVKDWLIDYMSESPLFFSVLEGYEAVSVVRKICGDTTPLFAAPGTIRGDFSHDNIDLANAQRRPLRNIIHASDTLEDAQKEVGLWFKPEEIFTYESAHEKFMYTAE